MIGNPLSGRHSNVPWIRGRFGRDFGCSFGHCFGLDLGHDGIDGL
jgi:hypothetical protein